LKVFMPRTLGPSLCGARGMEFWLLHRPSNPFLGVWQNDPVPGGRLSPTADYSESASRDAFLSFLPGMSQAPLLGFPKIAPPSDWAFDVHSCLRFPWLSPWIPFASARLCQRTSLVPSSWFPTTLTVYSVESLAGLLRPAADHGVRRVLDSTRRMPKHSPSFLLSRRVTLRSISTSVAVHHVSMALLDSCPLVVHHLRMARLQGFAPRRGSRDIQKPCGFRSLYSFLGFLLHSRFGRPCSQPSVPEGSGKREGEPSQTQVGTRVGSVGLLPPRTISRRSGSRFLFDGRTNRKMFLGFYQTRTALV
jgi:hypothetical protein